MRNKRKGPGKFRVWVGTAFQGLVVLYLGAAAPALMVYGAFHVLGREAMQPIIMLGLFGLWSLGCVLAGAAIQYRRQESMPPPMPWPWPDAATQPQGAVMDDQASDPPPQTTPFSLGGKRTDP